MFSCMSEGDQVPGPPPQEPVEPQPSGQKPKPVCKAILLCLRTIIDALTGEISVIGIFDRFVVDRMPASMRPFEVFLQLTSGIGRYDVVVEIHDLAKEVVIGRGMAPAIEFSERLESMNLIIPVPPLPLKHAGKYDLVVFANAQEIDRQPFTVSHPQGEKHEQ